MLNPRLKKAFDYTVTGNEGGAKYTNDPADAGGPTKYGVTLRTLSAWRAPRVVSADDVKALSSFEAAQIYEARYWKVAGCDRIAATSIALALFDMAVVMGPNSATLYAQMAVNAYLKNGAISPLVTEDGRMGPATLGWLSRIAPSAFLMIYRDLLLKRVDDIIHEHPPYEKFRHGWEERIKMLPSLQGGAG